MKVYTKNEAIKASKEFLKKVSSLEEEYGLSFNSDTGDIYLSYRTEEDNKYWDTVKIGWKGDGTGLKVFSKVKDDNYYKEKALSKLSEKEKEALGLNK